MSDKNVKDLRKQLKTVVADLLPEALSSALFLKLQQENRQRLDQIEKMVKDTLERIDSRGKDVQSFIMRQVAESMPQTSPPTSSDKQ